MAIMSAFTITALQAFTQGMALGDNIPNANTPAIEHTPPAIFSRISAYHVDQDGYFVTQDGHRLGQGLHDGFFAPARLTSHVDDNGYLVAQDGHRLAQIHLAHFTDIQPLVHEAQGLYDGFIPVGADAFVPEFDPANENPADPVPLRNLTRLANEMFAMSLRFIGKNVTISDSNSIDPVTGENTIITGTISATSIEESTGLILVIVNENSYLLGDILIIH